MGVRVSQSRWRFPTEKVVVGENAQEVRGLTHGERQQFTQLLKKSRDPESGVDNHAIQQFVVKCGAVNPTLTEEEVAGMPPLLSDACSTKIFELSGLSEKKETPTAS